jgi:hypothetical protein
MADGSRCCISDVRTGDKVLSADGKRVNTVMFVERLAATHWSHLYSPEAGVEPFATINHPLMVDGELVSPQPQNVVEFYPWLKRVRKIEGAAFTKTTDETVYNLWVTGDATFQVNGFGTHCIAGTGGLLRRLHDEGELSYDEVLRAAHYFATVPKDRRLGAKRLNDWLENIPLSASGRRRMAERLLEASSGAPGGFSTKLFRLACAAIGCAELLIDGAARRRSVDPMATLTREIRT